uniref:Serine/threonine-protein phosphatase 2A regulatory subunit B'' subunit beta n=1 Tax=Cacopsylla melanoneura TaxID=428564 RepID=A0A8D9BSW8_9HEMI
MVVMTTTANQQFSQSPSSNNEEDIAAIAKQISDHAEAIYQTWKSRGLAPTEILNHCHSNLNKVDVETSPGGGQGKAIEKSLGQSQSPTQPVMELLSTTPNNNLEQLVSQFVSEDKARLARQQKIYSPKPFTSTIQYALQKFEKKSNVAPPTGNIISSPLKPQSVTSPNHHSADSLESDYALGNSTWPLKHQQHHVHPGTDSVDNASPHSTTTTSSKYYTLPNNHVPFRNETPQQIKLKSPSSPSQSKEIPITIVREDGTSGAPTKVNNKPAIISPKPVLDASVYTNSNMSRRANNLQNTARSKSTTSNTPSNKLTENKELKTSLEYLDEVTREEERLINALKTGMVIENNSDGVSVTNPSLLGKTRGPCGAPASSAVNTIPINRLDANARSSTPSSVGRTTRTMETASRRSSESSASRAASNASGTSSSLLSSPIRPFLTRGSVAERVLLFEKCPTELILEKRPKRNSLSGDLHSRIQTYAKDSSSPYSNGDRSGGGPPPHTTLQRHTKANRNQLIPRFHYPFGKPASARDVDRILDQVRGVFASLGVKGQATKLEFGAVTKACDLPLYWKAPLFTACGGDKLGFVELNAFLEYLKDLFATCHDQAAKFMRILSRGGGGGPGPGAPYLVASDLMGLVQDVVDSHPGLTFLHQATEFHSRYVHTVISRIFYCVNTSWSGRISPAELRRSDLLRVISVLEHETDINQVTQYFSYEHFYVIYCKFWELDTDHDLIIDSSDLARHSDHALSSRMIDRIFSGTVTRSKHVMTYTEFVWFLLAEEDKAHPRAIEYWFRCMDLDGDGYLSMYELEYFYDEQLQRMDAIGIECLPFEDCLCQMLDMIKPEVPGKISLQDLKRCKMTRIFFDTFFNLEKYLDHEQRDPFASQRDDDSEMSDWDRFASEEYDMLVVEEGGNEAQGEKFIGNFWEKVIGNVLCSA